jgi:hypothetical protein
LRQDIFGICTRVKESFLISSEPMIFCSAKENHKAISMVTLTLYAAIAQAGHVDQHVVSIPTFPRHQVDEKQKSRDGRFQTYFQVMEGRNRIGVVNDDIKHLLGPEF